MRFGSISRRYVFARLRSVREQGAVLLEVVLALVLFVGAAAVLTSGLSSSLDGVERLRLNTHAADFAVSILSELQMGIKSLSVGGPQPFSPPRDGWSWEAVVLPSSGPREEDGLFQSVEVIVRHDDPPLVFRLHQIMRFAGGKRGLDAAPGVDGF